MRSLSVGFVTILLMTAACRAGAVQYFTVEEAQAALFPDAEEFRPAPVCACDLPRKDIERYSGVRLRAAEQPVWRVLEGGELTGWFILDEVFGKHEFITYAVALDPDGRVKGLEILDYRETHGGQVRDPAWRAQFTGRRFPDRFNLGKEIDNISGATLSCKHMTEGVRRILAIYHAALEGRGS